MHGMIEMGTHRHCSPNRSSPAAWALGIPCVLGTGSAAGGTAGRRLPPGDLPHPHPTWTYQIAGGPNPAYT